MMSRDSDTIAYYHESREKAVRRTYNTIMKYVNDKEIAIRDVAKSTGIREDKVREIVGHYS